MARTFSSGASRGEDIGIICGADIIALRRVTVESADYAQREYGATPEQVTAFAQEQQRTWRPIAEKVAKDMTEQSK